MTFPTASQPQALTFRIAIYNLQTKPFEVNPQHRDFYFEVNGDAITEVNFEDEHMAIEGQDLILRYWDKDKPLRYERQ